MKMEDKETFEFPVFVDTTVFSIRQEMLARLNGQHYPMYFGDLKDTIVVFHNISPSRESRYEGWELDYRPPTEEFDDYFYYPRNERGFESWNSAEMKLYLDTDQIIQNYGSEAYPLLIQNVQLDSVQVGYGEHLPLIVEAMDSKGKWRPIEEQFIYSCGTGMNFLVLPPNEFVVTPIVKTKGNYKTKLRVRYGISLSNEYFGNIDTTQFTSKWY
jgi:hypothetical protein